MFLSIHPGIWGAFATLVTGMAANVAISSAYQANTLVTLDFDAVDADVITGQIDPNDKVKQKQRELFVSWERGRATWYIGNCWQKSKQVASNQKPVDEEACKKHRADYKNSPEVLKEDVSTNDLVEHLNKVKARVGIQVSVR
ncbi:hypothetical protein MHLP_04400 [Candidatus Mycoplasma haematolamae str. Purdue]|uniref:Uncharacterized protein n=1 Tax=Mycoplasma haematolamae (strain Purdue) TaxID=1212765 RepID=I7BAZ4_MYCHA|nr:hypothetical protein [Candidatus Mycoplasma haematolamae]AFO52460.1 hypothetical protein MHLP_04400 [Candidatus Mycoplasma haematolamae str. Purdue]